MLCTRREAARLRNTGTPKLMKPALCRPLKAGGCVSGATAFQQRALRLNCSRIARCTRDSPAPLARPVANAAWARPARWLKRFGSVFSSYLQLLPAFCAATSTACPFRHVGPVRHGVQLMTKPEFIGTPDHKRISDRFGATKCPSEVRCGSKRLIGKIYQKSDNMRLEQSL